MRLITTADLHYNHPHSRHLADDLIDKINAIREMDALLLIGDTAAPAGDYLERCLSKFRFTGPKLFVPGNHELWTRDGDSHQLLADDLPRRIRALGWQWLQTDPFISKKCAILGTLGWYDYSFIDADLGIPRRFYESKISPGLASLSPQHAHLMPAADDVQPHARQLLARWNDGRFVRLDRPDEQFLSELLAQLEGQLRSVAAIPHVLVACHHLPFSQLLPDATGYQWRFARAFLGSRRIGQLLLQFPNVRQVLCGHSHFPAEQQIEHIRATNIGAGYRIKTYTELELPD